MRRVDIEMGRSGCSPMAEAIQMSPTQHLVCFSEDKQQKVQFLGGRAGSVSALNAKQIPRLGRPRGEEVHTGGGSGRSREPTEKKGQETVSQRQQEPLRPHPAARGGDASVGPAGGKTAHQLCLRDNKKQRLVKNIYEKPGASILTQHPHSLRTRQQRVEPNIIFLGRKQAFPQTSCHQDNEG